MSTAKSIRRKRLVRQYPAHSLEDVLPLALVIYEDNAGLPLDRTLLARGLGTTVSSSSFITKLASSEVYGLTRGRYRDPTVSLTDLGSSLVANRSHGELTRAATTAALKPPLFQKLRTLLQGMEIPEGHFLSNLLMRDVGISREQTSEFARIYQANDTYLRNLLGGSNEGPPSDRETKPAISRLPEPEEKRVIKKKSLERSSAITQFLVLIDVSIARDTGYQLSELFKKLDIECLYHPTGQPTKEITMPSDLNGAVGSIVLLAGSGENRELENAYALGLAQGIAPNRVLQVSEEKTDPDTSFRLRSSGEEIIESNVRSIGLSILEKFHSKGVLGINLT